MFTLCRTAVVAGILSLGLMGGASAEDKVKVVASFSILADFARNVGGDRVDVVPLVGPEGDAHVYTPSPADVKKVASAGLIVVNGLGLEGWMTRLVDAAGSKAPVVVASAGVKPLTKIRDGAPHVDPHAWQSIANARTYVTNIRDGLAKADPAGRSTYEGNAAAYLMRLDGLEAEVKAAIAAIPPERRQVVTSHDAFAYFGAAYGLRFMSPEGVTTESETSARDVAAIITQIREQGIHTLFVENVSDPRILQQIARESGARVEGTLFSDALSPPSGPAGTYVDMMRNNLRHFTQALTP